MEKYSSLLKLLFCIALVSTCIFLVDLSSVNADGQSASLPQRTIGDEWKFMLDYKGDVGLLCNLTTTVTEISVLNPSGTYECFELTSVGNGVVYGKNVSGTWSMNIKEYYGKSDFSLVEMKINRIVTVVGPNSSTTTTLTTNSVYDPPFGINNGFPLSAGKNWSAISNITSITHTDVDGQVSQENSTNTQSMNFSVARIENSVTTAGTFETFVLRGTGFDGSVQEIYYSSNVGMQVKEIDYAPTGNVTAIMSLIAYSVAGSANTLPIYWIALAIIVVAVAVSVLAIVAMKQRHSINAAPK